MGGKIKIEGNSPCRVDGIQPEIVLAIVIAGSVIGKLFKGLDCVLTSVTDSHEHMESFHNDGYAFDIRIRVFPQPVDKSAELAAQALRDSLGDEYDVVVEKDHIHVEFDPK